MDVRLNTDPPGSELSLFPVIATDAHRIYAVWYDRRAGTNTDIYFNRSLDAGSTWLAADRRLDTDVAGAAGSNVPQVCCAGDRVYAVWSDQRGGGTQIRFNRSLDAGTTWLLDDVRLDVDVSDAGSSKNVAICCDGSGSVVHVVWDDTRDGAADVYYQRSLDAGTSWLPADVRLDTDVAGSAASFLPQIGCSGSDVIVVWEDFRDGDADVRMNRSADGGATWQGVDVRLDSGTPGAAGSRAPQVACENTLVCVVWVDDRDGLTDVYANASQNGGASWLLEDVRVDTDAPGSATSQGVRVAVQSARATVVWEDHRFAEPSVFFSASDDGGASWPVSDVRLDRDAPGRSASRTPDLAVTPTHVHVVWSDDRQGAFDVVLLSSSDGGATWPAREMRLDADAPGAANSLFPRIAADGATARAVWVDERHGPGDVYFNRGVQTGP